MKPLTSSKPCVNPSKGQDIKKSNANIVSSSCKNTNNETARQDLTFSKFVEKLDLLAKEYMDYKNKKQIQAFLNYTFDKVYKDVAEKILEFFDQTDTAIKDKFVASIDGPDRKFKLPTSINDIYNKIIECQEENKQNVAVMCNNVSDFEVDLMLKSLNMAYELLCSYKDYQTALKSNTLAIESTSLIFNAEILDFLGKDEEDVKKIMKIYFKGLFEDKKDVVKTDDEKQKK